MVSQGQFVVVIRVHRQEGEHHERGAAEQGQGVGADVAGLQPTEATGDAGEPDGGALGGAVDAVSSKSTRPVTNWSPGRIRTSSLKASP